MKRLCVLWVSAVMALSADRASAQDVSAAKALFEKGVADLESGKFDTACPALGESYKMDPRPGTLFTLAECFAKGGKTASAVARYEDYLSTFGRMTPAEQAKQRGRDQTAREQHDRLKPRVPLLTLRLDAGAPPGTTVTRDGVELGKASLGLALPIDPGQHTVVTQAPGAPAVTETVTLVDGDKKDITLKLKPGGPAAIPPPSGPPAIAPSAATPDRPEPPGSGRRIAGFAIGGVGLAGLVAGAVTGGLTLAKKSTISDNCDLVTKVCKNSTGHDAVSSAQTTGLVSTIGFVVGGVALAGGAILVLTAPKAGGPSVTAAWSAGPGSASIGLRGAF